MLSENKEKEIEKEENIEIEEKEEDREKEMEKVFIPEKENEGEWEKGEEKGIVIKEVEGIEVEEEIEEKKKEKLSMKSFNRILFTASILAILISTFLVQFCVVSGGSMEPTLNEKDVVVIEKITRNFERMDIVVIKRNGRYLIKRVIGLPGEEIKIENGKIFVNGKEIEDVVEKTERAGIAAESILLGEDEYFLLGDNRENSMDSRDESIGKVKEKNIAGEGFFFFSFS